MIKVLFLLIIPFILNAQVVVTAPKIFLAGEAVFFNISASGSDVDFPDIKEISGFVVQKVGTSSQTSIINGVVNQTLIRQYKFFPTKDIILPSFDIKIDGKVEKTKLHKIILQKVSKTKSNMFDLTIKVNKNKVYVGEEILFTMIFKYKKDMQLYDLQFTPPNFENFWSKQLKSPKQQYDNLYIVQELNFLLFAQKSGILEIEPLKIGVVVPDLNQRNNFFGAVTKTKLVYSNYLKIDVKSLPKDINLIGDFKIKTKIDKNSIKQGEAVSLQLEISGRGNIDDLEEYNLDIPNATVYDNPSQKDFNIKNGKYGGIYKKSYSIVAQEDFIIPAVVLKYFDKKSQKVKIIKSDEYKIKVDGAVGVKKQLEVKEDPLAKIEVPKAQEQKIVTKVIETSNNDKILFFVLGFILSSVIFILYLTVKNRQIKEEDMPLQKTIKRCAASEELLKKLVPYINIDENLDKIIYELEQNANVDLRSIKKQVQNILKELKL